MTERQIEALVVAMIVAPGVYARNRMFDRLSTASARRARARAVILRGVLPQLARASGVTVEHEAHGSWVLRYAIPAIRLTRVVQLSGPELAALRVASERERVRCLPADPEAKAVVAGALAALMDEATALEALS